MDSTETKDGTVNGYEGILRLKSAGHGYWTVQEFMRNAFCGHWVSLFTSERPACDAFLKRARA